MKFKLALFDLGGTLIDFENRPWHELGMMGCRESSRFLKDNFGAEISPEVLNEKFYLVIDQMIESRTENDVEIDLIAETKEILRGFGIDMINGIPEKFIRAHYKPIREQITLVPGAVEILTELKQADVKIGLVSNTVFPADYHRSEMRDFGIFDYFDFTLFSCEEKIRKPNEDLYLRALTMGGTEAGQTVFIGDRLLEDVGGPQSVGIKGILKHVKRREYSADIEPFETIYDLAELRNIILQS